jgi:primosomal protein N'
MAEVGATGPDASGGERLTGAQADALAEVDAAIAARSGERLLLHGVTGSGKTEV